MRLIIGGKGQGKRDYVASAYNIAPADIVSELSAAKSAKVLYGLEEEVARCLREGIEPEAVVEELCRENPDIIIICRELGCGVVPVERFDREWRERTGRICCELAKTAESVERVLCGIAMRIK